MNVNSLASRGGEKKASTPAGSKWAGCWIKQHKLGAGAPDHSKSAPWMTALAWFRPSTSSWRFVIRVSKLMAMKSHPGAISRRKSSVVSSLSWFVERSVFSVTISSSLLEISPSRSDLVPSSFAIESLTSDSKASCAASSSASAFSMSFSMSALISERMLRMPSLSPSACRLCNITTSMPYPETKYVTKYQHVTKEVTKPAGEKCETQTTCETKTMGGHGGRGGWGGKGKGGKG